MPEHVHGAPGPTLREGREEEDEGTLERRPRHLSTTSDAAMGLSLAFEFAAAVAMFWFGGKLVDGWLQTAPWGQVIGAVLGWVGGILHVYVAVQRRRT